MKPSVKEALAVLKYLGLTLPITVEALHDAIQRDIRKDYPGAQLIGQPDSMEEEGVLYGLCTATENGIVYHFRDDGPKEHTIWNQCHELMHAFKRDVKVRQKNWQGGSASLRHDPVIDTIEEVRVETLAEGFMLLIVMGERALELVDTQDATAHDDEGDACAHGLRRRLARFERMLSF